MHVFFNYDDLLEKHKAILSKVRADIKKELDSYPAYGIFKN